MLKGKTVVLAVTGGIAAYKIPNLASMLKKLGADVQVLMTKNATNFITPITFESLTGTKCMVDTFDRNFQFSVEHVALAKRADVVLVAPATANVIGKLACGIADDMLTTTLLACRCKVFVAPAMNTRMYENSIVQDNLARLRRFGMEVIEPAAGHLACGDEGKGKMPEPAELLQYILREAAMQKDMAGLRVLVTAGPTREAIDPVRFVTNHSSGRMGYAIARNCMLRGAAVTLVTGPVSLTPPMFTDVVPVTSAAEMFEAVTSRAGEQDIVVKAAAVADYRPAAVAGEKIKKGDGALSLSLSLERTQDILAWLGAHKRPGQFLCGFAMETQDLLANARKKLEAKNADLIVANSLRTEGAGFGTDTNVVTLLAREGERQLPLMSKDDVAAQVVDEILRRREKNA